jgi:hypothetical protein
VKAAMQRDWAQTKHDLALGGHEMNQSISDTVNQASGLQHLPTMNEANPPKVIFEWSEAQVAYAFGHAAHLEFGAVHPQWSPELEFKLQNEWTAMVNKQRPAWPMVALAVRRAYEYDDNVVAVPVVLPAPAPKSDGASTSST